MWYPSLRRRFIAAVGHEDPAIDGRVDNVDAHYAALKTAVEATIASRTTAEWKTVLDARGVPASGVALPVEILDDAQPAANAMFHRFEHPALGTVTVLVSSVHLDGDGFTPGPPTAAFGGEARTILEWAGFNEPDVHRLLTGGAVTPPHLPSDDDSASCSGWAATLQIAMRTWTSRNPSVVSAPNAADERRVSHTDRDQQPRLVSSIRLFDNTLLLCDFAHARRAMAWTGKWVSG